MFFDRRDILYFRLNGYIFISSSSKHRKLPSSRYTTCTMWTCAYMYIVSRPLALCSCVLVMVMCFCCTYWYGCASVRVCVCVTWYFDIVVVSIFLPFVLMPAILVYESKMGFFPLKCIYMWPFFNNFVIHQMLFCQKLIFCTCICSVFFSSHFFFILACPFLSIVQFFLPHFIHKLEHSVCFFLFIFIFTFDSNKGFSCGFIRKVTCLFVSWKTVQQPQHIHAFNFYSLLSFFCDVKLFS